MPRGPLGGEGDPREKGGYRSSGAGGELQGANWRRGVAQLNTEGRWTSQSKYLEEGAKHRQTQTHTQIYRDTHRYTYTDTQIYTDTHTKTHAQTHTKTHTHRDIHTDTQIHRDTHTDTHKIGRAHV